MEKTRLESIVAEIENSPCYDEEKHGLILREVERLLEKIEQKPSTEGEVILEKEGMIIEVSLINFYGESIDIVFEKSCYSWEIFLNSQHFFEEKVPYSENCFDEIAEIVNKNF